MFSKSRGSNVVCDSDSGMEVPVVNVNWVERKQITAGNSATQSLFRLSEVIKRNNYFKGPYLDAPVSQVYNCFPPRTPIPIILLTKSKALINQLLQWLQLQAVLNNLTLVTKTKKKYFNLLEVAVHFNFQLLKIPPKWGSITLAPGFSACFPFDRHPSLDARILDWSSLTHE